MTRERPKLPRRNGDDAADQSAGPEFRSPEQAVIDRHLASSTLETPQVPFHSIGRYYLDSPLKDDTLSSSKRRSMVISIPWRKFHDKEEVRCNFYDVHGAQPSSSVAQCAGRELVRIPRAFSSAPCHRQYLFRRQQGLGRLSGDHAAGTPLDQCRTRGIGVADSRQC